MSLNKAPKNNVFYRNQNWHYPKITHGKGIHLFDDNGNSYIDACSGSAVANIGHGNTEIAEFAKNHIERIAFTHLSRWTVDSIEECAAKVAEWAPGDLNHVYFVSGGSESTETAAKMARQYFYERDGKNTSKSKIISKWNSFHGNTLGSLSMTGLVSRRKPYAPILLDFPKIEQFYHYRNPWNCQTNEETSIKSAAALEVEILRQGPENVAAFITEPVLGSAAPGVHPEKIYFQMVREICTKYDVLLIVDEVMSGFGRTGKRFACEHFDVVPDILTAAKGMSSGYTPMGACIASDKIFNTIMVEGSGLFVHGHTYAGNPLSCGIAHKVMEITDREGFVENAAKQGELLMSKMQTLYSNPIVGEVRGKGLMIGVELVQDKTTKQPLPLEANVRGKLATYGLEEGIVLYPGGGTADGVLGDHFLVAPPINITEEEVLDLFQKLEKTLARIAKDVL